VKIQALLWSHYGKSQDYFLQLQRAGGPLKGRKGLFLFQRQGFHLSRKSLSFIIGYLKIKRDNIPLIVPEQPLVVVYIPDGLLRIGELYRKP